MDDSKSDFVKTVQMTAPWQSNASSTAQLANTFKELHND